MTDRAVLTARIWPQVVLSAWRAQRVSCSCGPASPGARRRSRALAAPSWRAHHRPHRQPSGSMQMKPDKARPANSIGRTCGSRSARSRLSAPTQTINAIPVMPQHILPLTRKDRPSTIFISTTSLRPDSTCRTRSTAAGSELKRPVPRFVIRHVRHNQDAPFALQVHPVRLASAHAAVMKGPAAPPRRLFTYQLLCFRDRDIPGMAAARAASLPAVACVIAVLRPVYIAGRSSSLEGCGAPGLPAVSSAAPRPARPGLRDSVAR